MPPTSLSTHFTLHSSSPLRLNDGSLQTHNSTTQLDSVSSASRCISSSSSPHLHSSSSSQLSGKETKVALKQCLTKPHFMSTPTPHSVQWPHTHRFRSLTAVSVQHSVKQKMFSSCSACSAECKAFLAQQQPDRPKKSSFRIFGGLKTLLEQPLLLLFTSLLQCAREASPLCGLDTRQTLTWTQSFIHSIHSFDSFSALQFRI